MNDKAKTIMISPTSKASKRTKNRINERGPLFTKEAESTHGAQWLLRSGKWLGWLPRNQFKVENMTLQPNDELQILAG